MSALDNKSLFLGIPYGTAAGRLRKNILFSLVVRLGEDVCFKCSERILSVEELSIEHKEPWQNVKKEMFWDLNNIAFSHLRCNRPSKMKNGNTYKISCYKGHGFSPENLLNTKCGRICKTCKNDYQRARREKEKSNMRNR